MDLSTIFETVTKQLSEQQATLNEADTYNHDHGDHMVQIFELIQKAVQSTSDQSPSKQLEYASKVVEKEAASGSATLYAQGLSNAAKHLTGKDVQPDDLGILVKSLLNVEEAEEKKTESNLLGSLLSGLTGKPGKADDDQKIGMDTLLLAGMSFFQSKQEGVSTTDALMAALIGASPLGQTKHRALSGSLVAATIMDFAKSSQ